MKKIRLKMIALLVCVGMVGMLVSGCVSINVSDIGRVDSGAGVRGRGEHETFTFDVGEITELRVGIVSNIEFYTTHSDTITLEIQPNLMEYITVEESNGVLTVRSTRSINWHDNANVPILTVGSPVLSTASLTGAGNFTAHDTIAVDSFSIDIAGASDGTMELDVENLTVTIAGAADLTLSGNATNVDIILSGAGDIEALELQTQTANISLAGAGNVRISCSERLVVNAAGVGTIEYRGNPSLDLTRGGLVTVRNVD